MEFSCYTIYIHYNGHCISMSPLYKSWVTNSQKSTVYNSTCVYGTPLYSSDLPPFQIMVMRVCTSRIRYRPMPQDLKQTLSCEEMDQLLSIVQRVPLTEYDDRLVPLLKQKAKWYEVVTRYVRARTVLCMYCVYLLYVCMYYMYVLYVCTVCMHCM